MNRRQLGMSLGFKFISTILLSLFILSLTGGTLFLHIIRRNLKMETSEKATRFGQQVIALTRSSGKGRKKLAHQAQIEKYVKSIQKVSSGSEEVLYVTVLDAGGNVIAQTSRTAGKLENILSVKFPIIEDKRISGWVRVWYSTDHLVQEFVRHGKETCRKTPLCPQSCLREICECGKKQPAGM